MEYLNISRAALLLADLTGNPSATDDTQAIIEAGAQGEIPIYWRNSAQVWTRLSDFKGDLKGTDSAARHLQLEPHTVSQLETAPNATVLSFALTDQDFDTLTKLFGNFIDDDGNLLGYRHAIGDEVVTITRDQLRVHTDDLKAYAATLAPDAVSAAPDQEPATATQVQASQAEPPIDHTLLATPDQLIEAFGKFTGMSKEWFEHWDDKPGLKNANAYKGKRGNASTPPLFYVFPVMQWLCSPKLKVKGSRPISQAAAWRRLKLKFTEVYSAFQDQEPDPMPGK